MVPEMIQIGVYSSGEAVNGNGELVHVDAEEWITDDSIPVINCFLY